MNKATIKLPQFVSELKPKDLSRFWAKVKKDDPDKCWNWQASTDEWGYGKIAFGRLLMGAHRLSYLIHNESLVGGVVMHSCDNVLCVNPLHLSHGTDAMNMADKCAKGRQSKGTSHAHSKINENDVLIIRERRKSGETLRSIGKDFGLSISQIYFISIGTYWKHVN